MFNRILVAIDASQYSLRVVPTALEVAKRFHSQVFVLHAAEHDRGRTAVLSVETPSEGTRLVVDAVALMREAGVDAAGEVHDVAAGQVAKNIVETAADLKSDLVVMGSRGLSDVQGILLGSVTHKVIQLAPIAVLVARGPIPVKVKAPQPPASWRPPTGDASAEGHFCGGSTGPPRRVSRPGPSRPSPIHTALEPSGAHQRIQSPEGGTRRTQMNSAIRWRIITLQAVMVVVLAGAAIFAFGLGSFTTGQIKDELAAQQITFPTTAQLAADNRSSEYSDTFKSYAGQPLDNGDKARTYANDYLGVHLKGTANGLTYSTVGTKISQLKAQQANLSKDDPAYTDLQTQITTLTAARETLFKGETLRSMLLNAYGWWTIGVYTTYAGFGLMLAALVVLGALVFEVFVAVRKPETTKVAQKKAISATA